MGTGGGASVEDVLMFVTCLIMLLASPVVFLAIKGIFVIVMEGPAVEGQAVTPTERLLLQSMSDERRSFALGTDMMKALKWYHDNGVPQLFSRSEWAILKKP